MNWKPINKVIAAAVSGAVVYFAQKLWHHEPAALSQLLPYGVAVVMAYLVKLEAKFRL